jgi:hypothetical protein
MHWLACDMDIPAIKKSIAGALRSEAESGDLSAKLAQLLPQLHEKLVLPEDQPVEALMAFVRNYVESVPGCISLVSAVSKRLGFYDYAAPFLNMAEDYFLSPPEELPEDGGLEALLDESFLAHRLLEEVNDHHIRHLQRPLLPVDMTEANIIVHHLLGDELATRLEQLVQYAAQQLLSREHVWERVRSLPGGEAALPPKISSSNLAGAPQQIRLRLAS